MKSKIPWNKGKKGLQKAWNKGLTKETSKIMLQVSKKMKGQNTGKHPKKEFPKGYVPWNKGKTGLQVAWNKGLSTGYLTHTKENIKKMLKRREKSSLETKFENICIKFGLPYRFVGNGDFIIERKNPDFINTNGDKIAIEVYYRRHKEMFRNTNIQDWKKNRQDIFSKYGWKLLFFDETEVNENKIMQKLGE